MMEMIMDKPMQNLLYTLVILKANRYIECKYFGMIIVYVDVVSRFHSSKIHHFMGSFFE